MSGPVLGYSLARLQRREAHRAMYTGRSREHFQPQVSEDELFELAAEHAPRVLDSPEWFDESNLTRLDWMATEILRADRERVARAHHYAHGGALVARWSEHPYLSINQAIMRWQREIPHPHIGALVEFVMAGEAAWVSGRVLDPPNRGGYRQRLGYFIRWRDTTVFPFDLVPRHERMSTSVQDDPSSSGE